MKDNQKNTDPKAELVAKLEQMEREAGDYKPLALMTYVDNLLTNSDQRIAEKIAEAKATATLKANLEEEKTRLEEIVKNLEEANLPIRAEQQKKAHLEKVKRLQAISEPWDSEFWEREFLKELLPLFDGDFSRLVRKEGKRNIQFSYMTEGAGEQDSFAYPLDDYYDRLERFKEDIRQGGAIVAKRIEENSFQYALMNENYKRQLSDVNEKLKAVPEALDLSTTRGRKRDQQLWLPIVPEISELTERQSYLLREGLSERLQIAISQKLGLIRGKTFGSPKAFARYVDNFSKNFFTIKNIMRICSVGKDRAVQIIVDFTLANSIPRNVPSINKDETFENIRLMRYAGSRKANGLNGLKPKIELSAVSYLEAIGQVHNLPQIDSDNVRNLGNFAFRIMVQLGKYSHSIEAHHTKAELPKELWIGVNVRKLYEDLLKPTALPGGHSNRLKDEFVKAMEQLTANGIFREAPFLSMDLILKKDDTLRDQVEISNPPQLLKKSHITSLTAIKRPGTTWKDIIDRCLIFCLAFPSMREKDQTRISNAIEGKRKVRSIRTRKAKKSDRHHKGGSADRDEGIIYSGHK